MVVSAPCLTVLDAGTVMLNSSFTGTIPPCPLTLWTDILIQPSEPASYRLRLESSYFLPFRSWLVCNYSRLSGQLAGMMRDWWSGGESKIGSLWAGLCVASCAEAGRGKESGHARPVVGKNSNARALAEPSLMQPC